MKYTLAIRNCSKYYHWMGCCNSLIYIFDVGLCISRGSKVCIIHSHVYTLTSVASALVTFHNITNSTNISPVIFQDKGKVDHSDWTNFHPCNKRLGNEICCIIFYTKDFLRHECRCDAYFLLALSLFHWSFFAAIYMLYVFRQGIVFVSIVNTTVFAKQTIAQKSVRLR